MELKFVFEKETKGTRRYKEVVDDESSSAKVGVLYVKKSALAEIGNPDELVVSVKAKP